MSDKDKYTADGEDIQVVGPKWAEDEEEQEDEENPVDALERALDSTLSKDEWIPYLGPDDGEGWQSVQDPDDVRYGLDEPPGEVADGYEEQAEGWGESNDELDSDSWNPESIPEEAAEIPHSEWEDTEDISDIDPGDYVLLDHADMDKQVRARVIDPNADSFEFMFDGAFAEVRDIDLTDDFSPWDVSAHADASERVSDDSSGGTGGNIEQAFAEYDWEIEQALGDIDSFESESVQSRGDGEFKRLPTAQATDIRGVIRTQNPAGEDPAGDMWEAMQAVKQTATGQEATKMELLAKEAFGFDGEVFRDRFNEDYDPEFTEGDKRAMVMYSAASQKVMEDLYGEDYDLHRGVSDVGAANFAKAFLSNPGADEYSIEETILANYTVDHDVARSFAHRGLTITQTDPKPVNANDIIRGYYRASPGARESEVWLHGADQRESGENIRLGKARPFGGAEEIYASDIPDSIDEIERNGINVLTPHIDQLRQRAENGNVALSEETRTRMEQYYERAQQVYPGRDYPTTEEIRENVPVEKSEAVIDLTGTNDKGWLEWGREDTTEKNWIPYLGPDDGEGWQNSEDPDDVRYVDDPPGEVAEEYQDMAEDWGDNEETESNTGLDVEGVREVFGNINSGIFGDGESNDYRNKDHAAARLVVEGKADAETVAQAVIEENHGMDADDMSLDGRSSVELIGNFIGGESEWGVNLSYITSTNEYVTGQAKDEFKDEIAWGPHIDNIVDEGVNEWQLGMFSEETAPMFQLASDITGNDTLPEGGAYGGVDNIPDVLEQPVTYEEKEAFEAKMEQTQEILRDAFGDTMTVYRGINSVPGNPTHADNSDASDDILEAKENGEGVVHEHRPIESWTTNPAYSAIYATGDAQGNRNRGVMLEKEIPIERVMAASHTGRLHNRESEVIVMHDEEEEYTPEQIVDGDEITDKSLIEEILSIAEEERDTLKSDVEFNTRITADSFDPTWLHQDPPTQESEPVTKNWIPYVGPDGGEGWQDTQNPDDVRYIDDPPGEVADGYEEMAEDWGQKPSIGSLVTELEESNNPIKETVERVRENQISVENASDALLEAKDIDPDGSVYTRNLSNSITGAITETIQLGRQNNIEFSLYSNSIDRENIDLLREDFRLSTDIDRATQKMEEINTGWINEMWSERTAPLVQVASNMTQNTSLLTEESEVLEVNVEESKKELVKKKSEQTQKLFREAFGDTITVYRGLNDSFSENGKPASEIVKSIDKTGKVKHEHRPVESWTTSPGYASSWSGTGEKGGVTLKKEIPVERIMMASHNSYLANRESEIVVAHDEKEQYGEENILRSENIDNKTIVQEALSLDDNNSKEKQKGETSIITLEQIDPEWLHQKPLFESANDTASRQTEKNWIPYRGPQGGEGWQDTQNPNDVRYDLDEPPGTVAAGYDEDHWEQDERTTSQNDSELGYVSEGSDGPSLNVSTADYAESLHEAGASEGASSRHMHVATWESEDGSQRRAFVTNYGPDMRRNETGEKPLLGERAIAADAFFRNMGFDPPKHFLNRQQRYLAVEGKEGKEVRHAPDEWKKNIDRDEVLDFAATAIIAGNSDLHPKNVLVNKDGEFFAVDLDKSGGDFANGPDRFQRRGFQSITWTARNLGHSLSKEEIDQRAQELCRDMDIERMTENVENSTWSRKGRHQFRDNIITNIKALREGTLL